jgi:peroxiredoxin
MRATLACVLALVITVAWPDARAGDLSQTVLPVSLSLPGLDGKTHELREWRNKVLLLNFWASWCSPCQTEIRDLVDDQSRYATAGLQIIGIGLDDEEKLRNVQRSLEINYPVLLDNAPGHPVMAQFGNREGVVPYSVLISRRGKVIFTHAGPINQEMFVEQIVPLLH